MQRFEPKRSTLWFVVLSVILIPFVIWGLWTIFTHEKGIMLLPIIFLALASSAYLIRLQLRIKGYELAEDRVIVAGTGIEIPYNSIIDVETSLFSPYRMFGGWFLGRGPRFTNMKTMSNFMFDRVNIITEETIYILTPVDTKKFVSEIKKRIK